MSSSSVPTSRSFTDGRAPSQVQAGRLEASTVGLGSPPDTSVSLDKPAYTVGWLHLEEGEEGPSAGARLGLGWKTRLELLISR